MQPLRILLPGLALGAAALLLTPIESHAFITLGWNLPLSLRHGRVFDNFSGANANNNTNQHPNWPGYTGAELSLWKAMAEWGSELHGDGSGDPHQNAGLGSGGANFDVTWQGNATSIGNVTHNTHSMISGSQGGVLAYCEGFGSGWRIRYYSSWNWDDGPGTSISGMDLQGVGAHEYGHALGLDHSFVGGTTMYPTISGNGVAARSIEADDIAGVQSIYGSKAGSKPRITSINGSGMITIQGDNFNGSDNEVWFTQAGAGGTGAPIKVLGLPSNGTEITLSVPASAGPGDVLVKSGAGSSHADLSNAWPYGGVSGPNCTPTIYCTAKVNSIGWLPQIGWGGEPKLSTNDFVLTCLNGGLGSQPGVYFWSDSGPNAQPFQGGFLCTAPPVLRSSVHFYDVFGFVALPVPVSAPDVGITRRFQFWFRDPAHPDGSSVGLSDALEVTFCN